MAWVTQMAYRKRGWFQGARYCAPTRYEMLCNEMEEDSFLLQLIALYCTLLRAMVADCTNGLGGCRIFAEWLVISG